MQYTYKILEVNEQLRNMLIEFSAENQETLVVGTRLPYEDETLEQIVAMYAPVPFWMQASKKVQVPAVGTTATSTASVAIPEPAVEVPADKIARHERDILLYRSDWTQVPDAPLTAEQVAAWATYRQALRDVTDQDGFPSNVLWPDAPAA